MAEAQTKSDAGEDRMSPLNMLCQAPYSISDSLRPQIDALELWRNVEELGDRGSTVVKDIAAPELMDELREVIYTFAAESNGPRKDNGASMLLGRHRVVDEVATLPKILALAEASLGQGMRAGQFAASIKREGDGPLTLHADQAWLPAPFPDHNCVLMFCIPCEGMTEEGGATRIVPGWQSYRRYPTEQEVADSETIPIEVEKGSVAVWDGSVWHSSGSRTIAGTRTVLHATYQRLFTQPIDDYTYLLKDEQYMSTAPDAMLVGRRVVLLIGHS